MNTAILTAVAKFTELKSDKNYKASALVKLCEDYAAKNRNVTSAGNFSDFLFSFSAPELDDISAGRITYECWQFINNNGGKKVYKTSYALTDNHGLGKAWEDINKIITITNCEVKPENDAVTLYFGELVGASGAYFTHLKIAYNPYKDRDLYDVTGRAVSKTGGLKSVISERDVFASDLLKTCENICQLKFTLS